MMATAKSTSKSELTFEEIFDIVKRNDTANFDSVYLTLLKRPEYLTDMPDDDSYTMLHYIVSHGELNFFNKVIALPNKTFILLTQTATKPRKDILQIATENQTKSTNHKQLYELIYRLVIMDQCVDYAKHAQIPKCREMLIQDDELANLKPPYRKFFLIHHLAFNNLRAEFDQLKSICKFNLTLLTNDKKTASEVAFEQNHKDFGNYLESLSPEMRAIREGHEKEIIKQNEIKFEHDTKLEEQIKSNGGANMLACFTCPLTKEVFRDPVVLSDGFTYEREAIQEWLRLDSHTPRSPMTNIQLIDVTLECLFRNERRIFV